MFRNSVLTLLVACAFVTTTDAVLASDATTNVRDHRETVTVRDHRTKVTVRDHRTAPRKSETVTIPTPKFTCVDGRRILSVQGFQPVTSTDCDGYAFHYIAFKGASVFSVSLNAVTGNMEFDFIGLAN